jgi:hypothetical protein
VADAVLLRPQSPHLITVAEAVAVGELRQGPDGRAYYLKGNRGAAALDAGVEYQDNGQVTVTKTAGIAFLDGGRVYWDRSARAAHYKQVDDADFYAGVAVGNASEASTSMTLKLNVEQGRKVCLSRDPFSTTIIGTQALGGLNLLPRGGAWNFKLDATNEAQKLDALSKDGFGIAANAIVEFAFNIISDGAGTVVDVSLGAASATHATDADSIANHMLIHLDANATTIKAQSKSTAMSTVTATDTTKTYTEGAGNANRVEVWMDFRNPADVQLYVNAVNVLPASVFNLSGATTLYLLAHIEKTATTDAYEADVDWMFARTAEQ